MQCPNCNALMNRHAEKVICKSKFPEGEAVAFIYYCPRCGKVEAKFEQLSDDANYRRT